MKTILILFAHPALQKSRINKVLIEGLTKIEGVTFRDLYQTYPELDIDVGIEQQLLIDHDIIVFHHPFFWYSTPPILKEWQDLVLEHGWAYGSQGLALQDKLFFNVMTTGGRQEAYRSGGHNNFSIRQLLAPIEQTINLCKMHFIAPFVIHGTHSIQPDQVSTHRQAYHQILQMLRDEKVDLDRLRSLEYLNDLLTD